MNDTQQDEFANYFNRESEPKILITTNKKSSLVCGCSQYDFIYNYRSLRLILLLFC